MQRVNRAVARHGAPRGDQRLAGHLAAEHPLNRLVGRPATEDVDLDLLQVKQVKQFVQAVTHPRTTGVCSTGKNRDRCLDASAPGVRAGAHESARWTLARVTAT